MKKRHITHPQLHEQLLVGWVAGGMMMMIMMIVVDTPGEVNPKETKVQLTTTAGALDMRGFD